MSALVRLGALAASLVALAACSAPQVSGTLLTSYDAALAAEKTYLASGHVSPAEATTLRADRVAANKAVQAVVAAEAAGQSAGGLAPLATAAIAAYMAEATTANGGT
jgi:hypothetical protein